MQEKGAGMWILMSILAAHMKILRFYFALAGMLVCLTCQTGCTGGSAPVRTLETATNVLNGRCPEMVDEETRIDSIILSMEGHLEYYYTLLYRDKRNMNTAALNGFLIPSITNNVRENPELRMHRDSSVTMDFLYRDRNGEFVMEISVGPKDYQ